MFFLSKLLHLLAQPLNLVLLLLALGILAGHRRPLASRRMLLAALVLLVTSGFTTLPDALLAQLENQSPEITDAAELRGYTGIVVLGGALESGRVSAPYQHALLNASAERMTGAFALWRRNPSLRMVFTGGEGELFGSGPTEADRAQRFFTGMGLPADVLVLEDQSRNTYENAVLTRQLPGIDAGQRWLLVTSAWHMPRSLAVFRKAGWNVTPYPVDFRTAGVTPLTDFSFRDGPAHWELALHELIGIAVYRLTGRM